MLQDAATQEIINFAFSKQATSTGAQNAGSGGQIASVYYRPTFGVVEDFGRTLYPFENEVNFRVALEDVRKSPATFGFFVQ
jgi:hypothetical protein